MLPKGSRKIFANIFPVWALIIALYSIIRIFLVFAFGSVDYDGMFTTSYGRAFYLIIFLVLLTATLYIVAIPGIFRKKKMAWNLMLYGSIVYNISDLITISAGGNKCEGDVCQANNIMILTHTIIFYYILFQIKAYYEK
jgi:hypothetical protein